MRSGPKVLYTSLFALQYSTGYGSIYEGNGAAAALGFTGNPDVLSPPTGYVLGGWSYANGVITTYGNSGTASVDDFFGLAWALQADKMFSDAYEGGQLQFNVGMDPTGYLPGETGPNELANVNKGFGLQVGPGSELGNYSAIYLAGNDVQGQTGQTLIRSRIFRSGNGTPSRCSWASACKASASTASRYFMAPTLRIWGKERDIRALGCTPPAPAAISAT